MFYNLKQLINQKSKYLLIVAFILSVSLHAYNVFSSQRVGSDPLMQLGTAVNFLEGNGFSVLSTKDFVEIEKNTITAWPYFYRVLALPVLWITNNNIELTILIIIVISYAFFLFCLLVFINNLPIKETYLISLIACFVAPIVTTPLKYGGDIDWLTLGISLLTLILAINYWYKHQNLKTILLFSLLVSLLPHMRYAYIPQAIAFVLFFISVNLFSNKKMKNKIHYVLFLFPVSSLVYITQLPYFKSTSTHMVNRADYQSLAIENFQLWLKPFYAPFFNSFYPDYILYNFLMRFSFYEKTVVSFMIFFMIVSIFILIILIKRYLLNVKSIKDVYKKTKIYETGLVMIIITTLLFHILINRNTVYDFEDIKSGFFLLSSLSAINRYFIPLHISTILLATIYALSNKKFTNYFKVLIFTSVCFGFLHYSYLRILVYSPLNRKTNMNIVNNPPGSYNDVLKIGNNIKELKQTKRVFYITNIDITTSNNRQVRPYLFANGNAVIFVSKDVPKHNYKLNENDVLLQAVSSVEKLPENDWEIHYSGPIYSLYKFKK